MKLRRAPDDVRLDLTPMIDVVFLLLTFFLYAVILMVRADTLDVALPSLGSGVAAEARDAITLAIRVDGAIAIDGEIVEKDSVIERLRTLRDARPEAKLLLAVDENGRTGDMVGVTDMLIGAGFTNFSLLATPAGSGEPPADPAP